MQEEGNTKSSPSAAKSYFAALQIKSQFFWCWILHLSNEKEGTSTWPKKKGIETYVKREDYQFLTQFYYKKKWEFSFVQVADSREVCVALSQ